MVCVLSVKYMLFLYTFLQLIVFAIALRFGGVLKRVMLATGGLSVILLLSSDWLLKSLEVVCQ